MAHLSQAGAGQTVSKIGWVRRERYEAVPGHGAVPAAKTRRHPRPCREPDKVVGVRSTVDLDNGQQAARRKNSDALRQSL